MKKKAPVAKAAKTKTTPSVKPIEYALVMRTCKADMTSHHGFKWPESGIVTAPDWNPKPVCGFGLHGLLWGEGDSSLLDWSADAKWIVCRVDVATIVEIDGKVKFPSCDVVYCGDAMTAGKYVVENGGFGKRVVRGTATAGDRGTATAGDRGTATAGVSGTATAGVSGTATAGDRGTATAGVRGTATAGDRGTATAGVSGTATAGVSGIAIAGVRGTATAGDSGIAIAGDRGTATAGVSGTAIAGYGGVIAIQHWNGKRYKYKIATIKDEDGDGDLEPNIKYRLDDNVNFIKA